jgi:hypothetical protein
MTIKYMTVGPRSEAPKPVCGIALNRLGLKHASDSRACPCELRITNEFLFVLR